MQIIGFLVSLVVAILGFEGLASFSKSGDGSMLIVGLICGVMSVLGFLATLRGHSKLGSNRTQPKSNFPNTTSMSIASSRQAQPSIRYLGKWSNLKSVAWTGNQLVVVGTHGVIRISADGETWTAPTHEAIPNMNSIVWTGRQLVAVGETKGWPQHCGTIITSHDGVNWTNCSSKFETYNNSHRFVTWTGQKLIVVGSGRMLESVDGILWNGSVILDIDPLCLATCVTWTGTQFVIAKQRGTILTSPDGRTWTKQKSGTADDINSVVWTGNKLTAVGSKGTILNSLDGVTWIKETSGTSKDINSVIWTGKQLVAVGRGGLILTSPNGKTWMLRTSGTNEDLNCVIWTGIRLVIVGDHGVILDSDGVTWTASSYKRAYIPLTCPYGCPKCSSYGLVELRVPIDEYTKSPEWIESFGFICPRCTKMWSVMAYNETSVSWFEKHHDNSSTAHNLSICPKCKTNLSYYGCHDSYNCRKCGYSYFDSASAMLK